MTKQLLDHRGQPIDMMAYARTPASKPRVGGDLFGQWAGHDTVYTKLPGGAALQFDLSKLTLADFRAMRQHYQIGSSMNVLGFILHQIDWAIEGSSKNVNSFIEDEIRNSWTQLIRGMSQAFWAGFSPMAVNYENGTDGRVHIDSIKDLVPEECRVNWKEKEGWAPPGKLKPKIYSYDGFKQGGTLIRTANSLWYPLLMENGDHYGRKLLANAFPSWYFSNLMHLFANRYHERFGEPLPIGRAPLDAEVEVGQDKIVSGRKAIEGVVANIRNRAVAVLPSDRDPNGEYEYDIEYLESQMRGADFERYLNRLDEEMSLAVFTPILLFRTADVGSYNLGQAHLRIFQQMLNAIAGDMQFYIQNYLVDRIKAINFPNDTSTPRWVFRQQGQGDIDVYKELMSEMVRQERAMPDLEELSAITGISWEEAQVIAADPEPLSDVQNDDRGNGPTLELTAAKAIARQAATRTARSYEKGDPVELSHAKRFEEALVSGNMDQREAERVRLAVYAAANDWIDDVADVGLSAEQFKAGIERIVDGALATEAA